MTENRYFENTLELTIIARIICTIAFLICSRWCRWNKFWITTFFLTAQTRQLIKRSNSSKMVKQKKARYFKTFIFYISRVRLGMKFDYSSLWWSTWIESLCTFQIIVLCKVPLRLWLYVVYVIEFDIKGKQSRCTIVVAKKMSPSHQINCHQKLGSLQQSVADLQIWLRWKIVSFFKQYVKFFWVTLR